MDYEKLRARVRDVLRFGTLCGVFALAVFISGCPTAAPSGEAGCDTVDDCTAAGPCQTAACNVDGDCVYTDVCTADEVCNEDVDPPRCDACGQAGQADCDDTDLCTDDTCGADGQCAFTATAVAAACDDADACNGAETCDPATGACVDGTPLDCDDLIACTTDDCDAAAGCTNVDNCPAGEVCDMTPPGTCEPEVPPGNTGLETAANEAVDFAALAVGETVTLVAPPAPGLTRQVGAGCTCVWTVAPTTAGTFDPTDDCTTDFTVLEAGAFIITVVVTCDGADTTFDQDATATVVSTEFAVSITGCPTEGLASGATADLTAGVVNETADGLVVYTWDIVGSGVLDGDDDDTPETVTFTSAGGSVTITVTAQDNTIVTPATDPVVSATTCAADGDCPAGDICNADSLCETPGTDAVLDPVGDPVTDTCEIGVSTVAVLKVNAGANRIGIPTFPSTGFVAGGIIIGPTGPQAPIDPVHGVGRDLVANVTDPDFDDAELTVTWEIIAVPPPAELGNVEIAQPNALSTDVNVTSVSTYNLNVIARTGLVSQATGSPVPGDYTFRVTVVNPNNASADSEVTITYVPAHIIYGNFPGIPGTSAEGMSHSFRGITNFVTRANQQIDVDAAALTAAGGTAQFFALNANGSSAAAIPGAATGNNPDITLNSVAVSPAVDAQNLTVEFLAGVADTYNIGALWAAGVNTAALDVLQPVAALPVNVHVQPDPLPSAVNVSPTQTEIGVVSPDTILVANRRTVHGYIGGTTYDGQFAQSVDLWGDSLPEVVAVNNVTDTWTINATTTADPSLSTTATVNNSVNNDGVPGGGAAAVVIAQTGAPGPVSAVHFADLNADNKPEMIVGDPTTGDGRVLVYFHTTGAVTFGTTDPYAGVTGSPVIITDGSFAAGGLGDSPAFGWSVDVGDVTGDGRSDIIIGAPGWDAPGVDALCDTVDDVLDTGRVVLISGPSLVAGTNVTVQCDGAGAFARYEASQGQAADDHVGFSVAVADFDGNGTGDVCIGGPGRTHPGPDGDFAVVGDNVADVGEVVVVGGGTFSSGTLLSEAGALRVFRGPVGTATYALGVRMMAGNVTQGLSAAGHDLVVRAMDGATGTGRLLVIPDGQTSGDIPGSIPQRAASSGHNFAMNFGIGNYNGDDWDDLLVGDDDTTATAKDSVQMIFGAASISATLSANTTVTLDDTGGAGPNLDAPADLAVFATGFLDGDGGDNLLTEFISVGDVNGDNTPDAYWSHGTTGGTASDTGAAIMGIPAPVTP